MYTNEQRVTMEGLNPCIQYSNRYNEFSIPMPAIYTEEVFSTSPFFPDNYIGNFGTIVDIESGTILYKSTIGGRHVVNVRRRIITPNGLRFAARELVYVSYMVLLAHFPLIEDLSGRFVVYASGNTLRDVYIPGSSLSNIEWGMRINSTQIDDVMTVDDKLIHVELSDEMINSIYQMFLAGVSVDGVIRALNMPDTVKCRKTLCSIRDQSCFTHVTKRYPKVEAISHSEYEYHCLCDVLQDVVKNGITNDILISAVLSMRYGVDGFSKNTIRSIRKYRDKFNKKISHIIQQYDF